MIVPGNVLNWYLVVDVVVIIVVYSVVDDDDVVVVVVGYADVLILANPYSVYVICNGFLFN